MESLDNYRMKSQINQDQKSRGFARKISEYLEPTLYVKESDILRDYQTYKCNFKCLII